MNYNDLISRSLLMSMFLFSAPVSFCADATAPASALAFAADGTNGFVFNTGILKGHLREGGRSKGLSSVVHIPTGQELDRSMGLFGHYRVFTANKRYGGGAWDWPSEGALQKDGSVKVTWPAAPDRPFQIQAVYRWAGPAILDLETTVLAKGALSKFESFLACYFHPSFTNSLAWCRVSGDKASFVSAEPDRGVWLTFPRDEVAISIFKDGRWTIPPSPVDWVMMPQLAAPLGFRRAPANGLSAVIMAPPEDAFAICTPNRGEGHYSMYVSLFGGDLAAGETARVQARLSILANASEADITKAYDTYVKKAGSER